MFRYETKITLVSFLVPFCTGVAAYILNDYFEFLIDTSIDWGIEKLKASNTAVVTSDSIAGS